MKKNSVSAILKNYMMLLVLVGVVIVFAILGPLVANRNFLAPQNLLNILGQNAYMVILGIGITFIMLGGGMDLSTGYLISTVGVIMALVDQASGSFVLALGVGLVAGILFSGFNGAVYSWLKVFPFIITLATQYMLNGATYLLSGGRTATYKGLSDGFKILGGYYINLGIGNLKSGVIVMIVAVIIGSFILNKTYFGRNVYALGSNPEAVALSGVSVAKMRILIFALAGLFFALAQAVNIGSLGSMNNSMGIGAEFTVMAGAMLGGIKMGGGGGKMSNMVIGVLIIGVLNSGMNFLNLNQYWQYVVLGVVLLAAVITDTLQTVAAANAAKKVTGSAPVEKKEEAAAE